jgi:hypothetical protein
MCAAAASASISIAVFQDFKREIGKKAMLQRTRQIASCELSLGCPSGSPSESEASATSASSACDIKALFCCVKLTLVQFQNSLAASRISDDRASVYASP